MCVCCLFQLCATPWTVAHQALLSVGFSRQEYWSGLPLLTPGDLPDPGIEPPSPSSSSLAGKFFTTVPPFNVTIFIEKYVEEYVPKIASGDLWGLVYICL